MSAETTNNTEEECCPPFDPSKYQDGTKPYKLIHWKNKPFVTDGTRCLFYIPLAFDKAVARALEKIEKSDASVPNEEFMILSECSSLWWSDVLVSTSKEQVEGAVVRNISGLFLAKAFEGSYSKMGEWVKECEELAIEVRGKMAEEKQISLAGQTDQNVLFYYPTCPKCAKKYGKNYVVVFTKISDDE